MEFAPIPASELRKEQWSELYNSMKDNTSIAYMGQFRKYAFSNHDLKQFYIDIQIFIHIFMGCKCHKTCPTHEIVKHCFHAYINVQEILRS